MLPCEICGGYYERHEMASASVCIDCKKEKVLDELDGMESRRHYLQGCADVLTELLGPGR